MLAAPMARLQQKTQAAVTTGTPKQSGIPCAMVLRLLRDLPGVPGLIAPVAREFLHELDPSVGGPGQHDLTVRTDALRLLRIDPSIASRATCRDDRDTPLQRARDDATQGQ